MERKGTCTLNLYQVRGVWCIEIFPPRRRWNSTPQINIIKFRCHRFSVPSYVVIHHYAEILDVAMFCQVTHCAGQGKKWWPERWN
jgi:hypothetical protein